MTRGRFLPAERGPDRPCPVCGAVESRTLWSQRFSKISGGLLDGYDVVVCTRCGCGFANGIPGQEAFDNYYAELSKYDYAEKGGEEPVENLARFDAIADRIVAFSPRPETRFLEIGCSTGLLLSAIRRRGYPEVRGLDPSPYCAAAAKRLHGLEVETGTLGRHGCAGGIADYAILVGVIEHVRELTPALDACRRLVGAGGRLYLEVPDVTQFARWMDAPFQQFSTEHVNFFSPVSLTNLLHRFGFAPLSIETSARAHTSTSRMPVISAVFEERVGTPADIVRDEVTETALGRYIEESEGMDRHLQSAIDGVVDDNVPIIVWGTGTHTSRLLETSRLGQARIAFFIDSNPNYHGRDLAGIPIRHPGALKESALPVVISSRVFQRDIEAQIRDQMGCPNRIVRLYEE